MPVAIDEVDVILGELASNAVRYGADPMSISVIAQDDALEICTFDSGDGYDLEQKLAVEAEGETGRGLRILQAFSHHLSACRDAAGFFCVCVLLKTGADA